MLDIVVVTSLTKIPSYAPNKAILSVVGAMDGYDNDVSNAIVDDNIIHDDNESDFSVQYYCVVDVLYEDYDIF